MLKVDYNCTYKIKNFKYKISRLLKNDPHLIKFETSMINTSGYYCLLFLPWPKCFHSFFFSDPGDLYYIHEPTARVRFRIVLLTGGSFNLTCILNRGVWFSCVAGLPDQMFTWLVHDTMMPVSDNMWIRETLCIAEIFHILLHISFCRKPGGYIVFFCDTTVGIERQRD